jgi:hypothetical protein
VETAQTGYAHTELHCPLLNAPQDVQAEIREDTRGQKTSVAVVEPDKQFVQEGNERTVEALGDIAEYSRFGKRYICSTQSMEVTKKTMPRISFNTGTMGLL